jgi:hypothetical protein
MDPPQFVLTAASVGHFEFVEGAWPGYDDASVADAQQYGKPPTPKTVTE